MDRPAVDDGGSTPPAGPEGFAWGDAQFIGPWTLEDVVAFVRRVAEIVVEERER